MENWEELVEKYENLNLDKFILGIDGYIQLAEQNPLMSDW